MNKYYSLILTFGVFSIINTEMGIIGILPLIAQKFQVSISVAGLLVSLFALAVAVAGPTMPLIFSKFNRKSAMLLVQAIFLVSTIFSALTESFAVLLISRILPAFFHPIYCSLAFTVAGASTSAENAPKAVSKVLMGVSAGMVLGIPIVSFIASVSSLSLAMWSFVLVNGLAFLCTLVFIPSMPAQTSLGYGEQLGILKKVNIWFALATIIFLNGAIFGVYSFSAEYLGLVTRLSASTISLILLIYGLANLIGNYIAGRMLTSCTNKFVLSFPFALIAVYLLLFCTGQFSLATALLTLVWGVLAGAGANINQYWISSAAPQAPDFANGLFLAAANLGTTLGTSLAGFFIATLGIEYFMFAGVIFAICGIICILYRTGLPKMAQNKILIQRR